MPEQSGSKLCRIALQKTASYGVVLDPCYPLYCSLWLPVIPASTRWHQVLTGDVITLDAKGQCHWRTVTPKIFPPQGLVGSGMPGLDFFLFALRQRTKLSVTKSWKTEGTNSREKTNGNTKNNKDKGAQCSKLTHGMQYVEWSLSQYFCALHWSCIAGVAIALQRYNHPGG